MALATMAMGDHEYDYGYMIINAIPVFSLSAQYRGPTPSKTFLLLAEVCSSVNLAEGCRFSPSAANLAKGCI